MGTNIDKLSYFGYKFQIKIIAALISDKIFLQQVSDILDSSFFESEGMQWIVKTAMEHFNKYQESLTTDVLKVKLSSETDKILIESLKGIITDAFKNIESEDLAYVKDETIAFCKNQKLKQAIYESVDLLKSGNYDKIKYMIDEAMKAGSDKAIGHEYEKSILARLKEDLRDVKPLPWDCINQITQGGFGKGELIVVAAGPGVGKSMCLVNIAGNYLKKGYNVLYYTLELGEEYVGRRFDSYLTGIAQPDLIYHQAEIEAAISKLKGKLVIKYYPTKTASINTISAHIDKCRSMDIKPDIIIVDYADLLTDAKHKSSNTRNDIMLGSIYEDLRGLAGIHNVPLFTASQLNRSSLDLDIVQADKISESFAKVMIADFVVSLSRKVTDKISGTGRWHVIKNRFGPDGLTFPSKINMSTCLMELYEETTVQGKEQKKKMDNEDVVMRSLAKNKFEELMGGKKNSLG